jgi:hypothetical protein
MAKRAKDSKKADKKQVPLVGQALEKAARELLELGWGDEHWNLLKKSARILFHHTPGVLPCLCRKCSPTVTTAEADGLVYRRDFVVSEKYALPFWAPEELYEQNGEEQLRRGMRESLEARKKILKQRARRAGQINPFTGQRIG